MRLAMVFLAVICFAGMAYAEDSAAPVPVQDDTNLEIRDSFYCQQPHSGWNAGNASTGFDSEEADDIPNDLAGSVIGEVTLYHAQWGGGYTNPTALIINFYDGACPPAMDPVTTFVIPFDDLVTTLVYSGSWFVMEMIATLPEGVLITENMSIGGVIDNNWGQNPPYNGLVFTDDGVIAGCGGGYWSGDYWGYPRWTPFASYFGNFDLAYCLGGEVTATDGSTWGTIKGLFR